MMHYENFLFSDSFLCKLYGFEKLWNLILCFMFFNINTLFSKLSILTSFAGCTITDSAISVKINMLAHRHFPIF